MKLTFIGTRGNIRYRSRWHYNHASLLVQHATTTILIDCGSDWRLTVQQGLLQPQAIFVTHAHSDHAGGLVDGAPCPVYATQESWRIMQSYAIAQPQLIENRKLIKIDSLTIEAFSVDHSLRAPAVGYRIGSEKKSFFYVPDLIKIHDQHDALADINVYIGDGAIITRILLERVRDHTMIGHTPIEKQLIWCKEEGIKWAIFSHCGSEIVKRDDEIMRAVLAKLGQHYGIETQLAYDGMVINL